MVGSLWTGISGLATQQAALDNESHNIANVNTIGYKASRISFADQMYQDSIGKGSKVLDVEKVFSQGNMKATGVSYDMALEGSGFFAVKDPNATGSSEEFYTRAGNFRMGEGGTLQDANAYDVIGWGLSPIDASADIVSTNSNINNFTNDYTQIAANQIIKKAGMVETITAKFTDYQSTAESDDKTLMSGLGYKTMSSKIRDTELLITDYQEKLKNYANDPEANSSPSIAQISALGLPAVGTSSMTTESDQLSVYIDGEKVSVNYVETSATQDLTDQDYDGDTATSAGVLDTDDDVLASRIATYKALADKISEKPGLVAYIVDPSTVDLTNSTTIQASTFGKIEGATANYSDTVGSEPILVIESLVPGKEFVVGDVGEYIASSASIVPGTGVTVTAAVEGTGIGAVESARDALVKAGSGFQRDVWSSTELSTIAAGDAMTFSLVNPNDSTSPFSLTLNEGGTAITYDASNTGTLTDVAANFDDATKIDALVEAINGHSEMSQYVTAHNYNGRLVIETINTSPGEAFVATLDYDAAGATPAIANNKSTTLSVNSGADSEFIEMTTNLNQTASRGELQLRLDNLGISDSAFGEFNVDSTGLITMTQDGATFAVGQVSVAMFNNERGLEAEGNNLYSKTTDSGNPIYNTNNDKAASVASKTLELSTADLSESLVNLMVFQRAFEANSKSITTSDSILNTLIQLKAR